MATTDVDALTPTQAAPEIGGRLSGFSVGFNGAIQSLPKIVSAFGSCRGVLAVGAGLYGYEACHDIFWPIPLLVELREQL